MSGRRITSGSSKPWWATAPTFFAAGAAPGLALVTCMNSDLNFAGNPSCL